MPHGLAEVGRALDRVDDHLAVGGTATHAQRNLHTCIAEAPYLAIQLGLRFDLGVRNADHDIARFGGFLRYEWASGELSLSAGVAMDGPNSRWEETVGPFGTLSVLMRF